MNQTLCKECKNDKFWTRLKGIMTSTMICKFCGAEQ